MIPSLACHARSHACHFCARVSMQYKRRIKFGCTAVKHCKMHKRLHLLQTLASASVILLVLDATNPVTRQDLALAQKVLEEGRALVVALNKMDTQKDPKVLIDAMRDRIERAVWEAGGVQCIPMSAINGRGIDAIMPAV